VWEGFQEHYTFNQTLISEEENGHSQSTSQVCVEFMINSSDSVDSYCATSELVFYIRRVAEDKMVPVEGGKQLSSNAAGHLKSRLLSIRQEELPECLQSEYDSHTALAPMSPSFLQQNDPRIQNSNALPRWLPDQSLPL
jgi:hypothetical protein